MEKLSSVKIYLPDPNLYKKLKPSIMKVISEFLLTKEKDLFPLGNQNLLEKLTAIPLSFKDLSLKDIKLKNQSTMNFSRD